MMYLSPNKNKTKATIVTKSEIELNNHLLEQGWKEGAASPERVANLIERLSLRNKLRMAAVAIADTEHEDLSFAEDFERSAA